MDQTGIVIFQAKDLCKVLLDDQTIVQGSVSGKFRKQALTLSDYPIVGDRVRGKRHDPTQFLIEAILPRSSFLQRKVAGNRQDVQGIAANVETVFITTSANAEFNLARLDRFMTIVWDSGANPVLVLTKVDQITPAEKEAYIAQLAAHFLGVPILCTSMYEDHRPDFSAYLTAGSIVTFIGSSGVGKSTLLNQLLGRQAQATTDVREDTRGRHTTTSRHLFRLANGAMVIDTPGMREIDLSTVQADSVKHSFQLIYDLAKECRFSDCHHETEPHCRVKDALESGELDPELFKSYRKMAKEIAYLERKERYKTLKMKK